MRSCAGFLKTLKDENLDQVHQIWNLASEQQKIQMLGANDYYAFKFAASTGQIMITKQLWAWAKDQQKQEMIAAEGYYSFGWAAVSGHIEVVKQIWSWASDQQKHEMLVSNLYDVFHCAASNHSIHFINDIWNMATVQQKKLIITFLNEECDIGKLQKAEIWCAIYQNKTNFIAFFPAFVFLLSLCICCARVMLRTAKYVHG